MYKFPPHLHDTVLFKTLQLVQFANTCTLACFVCCMLQVGACTSEVPEALYTGCMVTGCSVEYSNAKAYSLACCNGLIKIEDSVETKCIGIQTNRSSLLPARS